jgi:hypothetical protein
MSSRNASTLGQTRERIIILLVALAVPLIVQFFLYILASAAGATSLPVVGYGIAACAAATCKAKGPMASWEEEERFTGRVQFLDQTSFSGESRTPWYGNKILITRPDVQR